MTIFLLVAFKFLIVFTAIDASLCPDIPTVANFKIDKFAKGVWREVYHATDDAFHKPQGKCVEKRPRFDPLSEVLTIETYQISELTNTPERVKCYGRLGADTGNFVFPIKNASYPFDHINFRLVDIDYDSYGVGYVCNEFEGKRYLSVAVCTRPNHQLTHSQLVEIKKSFDFYGVKLQLIPTDWQDCRVTCNA